MDVQADERAVGVLQVRQVQPAVRDRSAGPGGFTGAARFAAAPSFACITWEIPDLAGGAFPFTG
jgi:hypothetical protein